jgi:hypothetical protein
MQKVQRISPEKLTTNDTDFRMQLSRLVVTWANCETWFMRLLAVLLRTDVGRADLVYSSMTSTRARTEIVKRLALQCLPDVRQIRHLYKLCNEFKAVTELRNRLCHSQYLFKPSTMTLTEILSTNFQRSDFDGTNEQIVRRIDRGFINEVTQASNKAVSLSGRLERFMKSIDGGVVLELPRDTPVPLDKLQKKKLRPRANSKKSPTPQKRRAPSRV